MCLQFTDFQVANLKLEEGTNAAGDSADPVEQADQLA